MLRSYFPLVVVYHGYGGKASMIIEEPKVQRSLDYLEHLWWVMHHSYSPYLKTFALTSYLDDSGSDDLSPLTAIGGPIMSKDAFCDFSDEWAQKLRYHRIPQPLHMKDFSGSGKHAGMYPELKMALFYDVVKLVNDHKLYSISITVSGEAFNAVLSEEVRKNLIGPYAMAFFCAVLGNHTFSSHSTIYAAERIAYLIDSGFGFSDQLVKAHAAIIEAYRANGKSCFVGSMAFDTDDRVPALQAADVIAWAARGRELDGLRDEFEPLNGLLSGESPPHAHIPLPKGGIEMIAKPINNWLSTGIMPSLGDILTVR